jgi:hypothetical protein
MSQHVYAEPRIVTDLAECEFYHTMDVPGYGVQRGAWDLRVGLSDYLGRVDLRGKRVLEMGTADGFISFEIERQGAEVVSHDLSDAYSFDVVPYAGIDVDQVVVRMREQMKRLNSAYWLSHGAFRSQAKMVYSDVYTLPAEIGPVDVCIFGSLLLHVRDPFLALQKALTLTRKTAIVTDRLPILRAPSWLRTMDRFAPVTARPMFAPSIQFMPDWRTQIPTDTWWWLSPELVKRFLGVLGFRRTRVTYHRQPTTGRYGWLFTVVGTRTAGDV